MVFSTDNGGYVNPVTFCSDGDASTHGTYCQNGEAGANNYPLRGGKYYSFEGGVRGTAFVSGGYLPEARRGQTLDGATQLLHIADWYSTFCYLAGVDPVDEEAAKWDLPPIGL